MARKATKDTYAIENVGGVEVRRAVFAGDQVPEQYEIEDGAVEETEDSGESKVGSTSDEGESSAAYGDSPDPSQQQQAEEQQSSEEQESAQSPAQGKRAGRNK